MQHLIQQNGRWKLILLLFLIGTGDYSLAQETIVHYLSGTDKDHTVNWDFTVSTGMNSGRWSKIAVPSCWEEQGFGTFNYYEDKINPAEQGFYKYRFTTDPLWRNKKIFLVFEGSMTDTEVKIDGKSAGPVHQGGFYQFRYDVTDLLQQKKDHLLEVTVSKRSANKSVNRAERQADFWLFGGIFRPVFLEILPQTFIEHIAIDAKANGGLNVDVFSKNTRNQQTIEVQVEELSGKPVGKPFTATAHDSSHLQNTFSGIRTWNPEQPVLYNAVISITEGKKIIHKTKQRFGFRTVEFREHDGFYVNNAKVIFKGVCRHSQWPESGRTLSRSIHLMDIGLMKEMNMNAVRMSHYPPDREFLDLCDSLGLFVLDELTGWQKSYDTITGRRLVKEMVLRDVNHPSVIMWDNGNEGGWNRSLDGDYHLYDPQKRFVIHPWEKFNGTETKHYPDFNYVTNAALYGEEVFFPTEFMHGLYDGGLGAGLEDFWNEMKKHKGFSGGFLWSFHDEGVVRTDEGGRIDIAGNNAPDGIVGPHREKEASFYTIKELWSPVYINSHTGFNQIRHKIEVENTYLYTNLKSCKFEWKLVALPLPNENSTQEKVLQRGIVASPDIAPGDKGWLLPDLPQTTNADAFYLTAYNADGAVICTWSWPVKDAATATKTLLCSPPIEPATIAASGNSYLIRCDKINYYFDTSSGCLQKVISNNKEISFGNGPSPAGGKLFFKGIKYVQAGNTVYLQVAYENKFRVQWIFESGKLPKLQYEYAQKDAADFLGITFNYPEEKITGMKWMGRGPYRVWKNRLKGQQFGVWQKEYNNTITGESWNYPEFKGWHADVYWVKVQNKEADFTIYTDCQHIFLQMLQPQKPQGATNDYTNPPFPDGNIGFMNAISAMGTKFQSADQMGPQSQKNIQMNYTPISGALYFDFR